MMTTESQRLRSARLALAACAAAMLALPACLVDVDSGRVTDTDATTATGDTATTTGADAEDTAEPPAARLQAAPLRCEFGLGAVGTTMSRTVSIQNTGGVAVDVSQATLTGPFTLGDNHLPRTLAPGETLALTIDHTPASACGVTAGEARLTYSPGDGELVIPIEAGEPSADAITIAEGDEVIPQTRLHLEGRPSCGGAVVAYEWTVAQPVGSTAVFIPSATVAAPTLEVNVAGLYELELTMWGEDGEIVERVQKSVQVTPDEQLHVELLWRTPADEDETDDGPDAGSDLDLHFLRPGADWFDAAGDVYWHNAEPNWGSIDPLVDDDPSLDRDDTDGAGPENMNVDVLADGAYRVGVHYWDDHGFGASFATLRVYAHGTLVFTCEDVELAPGDLWEVGTVTMPGLVVSGSCGDEAITHDFYLPPPYDQQP
ncbi:MAG: hypothetical protein H6745_13855 [Deltaproteobacteria bacterium]|nr:hypothetical protein [Deltaproteobacteria bacterium]